jgi:hypothetical protein
MTAAASSDLGNEVRPKAWNSSVAIRDIFDTEDREHESKSTKNDCLLEV